MAKRKNKNRGSVKARTVIAVAGLLIAGAAVAILLQPKSSVPTSSTSPKSPALLDSRLEALAVTAGLNRDWLAETRAEITADPTICSTTALGCYATNGNAGYIWIKEKALAKPDGGLAPVAHEYLTYVRQFKMSSADRQLGDRLMRDFYQKNQAWLDNRLRNEYSAADKDSDLYLDNIHSTVCTEVSDAKMGADLTAYCNKWVKTAALPDSLK